MRRATRNPHSSSTSARRTCSQSAECAGATFGPTASSRRSSDTCTLTWALLQSTPVCRRNKAVYPGSAESLDARFSLVSADLVAKAMLWAAINGQCTAPGHTFNVTNGDLVTMRSLWTYVAQLYQLELLLSTTEATSVSYSSSTPDWCVSDEVRRVWTELCATHRLERAPIDIYPCVQLGLYCIQASRRHPVFGPNSSSRIPGGEELSRRSYSSFEPNGRPAPRTRPESFVTILDRFGVVIHCYWWEPVKDFL